MNTQWLRIGVLAVWVFFAAGCGPIKSLFGGDGPPTLAMTLIGKSGMNGGNAASVFIYQLSGSANFKTTPVSTFWRAPAQALGRDLITSREVRLFPGQRRDITIEVREDTQFIGIAASLRNPAQDHWRVIYPLETLLPARSIVRVRSGRISVALE